MALTVHIDGISAISGLVGSHGYGWDKRWPVRARHRPLPVPFAMAQLRPLVALTLLLLAALSWLADVRPLPRIEPAQAAAWEGQAVVVSGWAHAVERQGDGGQRMTLRLSGHGIDAMASVADVRAGDWVEATGRLARLSGRLFLFAERLEVVRGPGPADPGWADLAEGISQYVGEPLRLVGTLEGDRLRDDHGHSLELGRGPWPPDGPADIVGIVAYDSACLCHRIDAAGSTWTT